MGSVSNFCDCRNESSNSCMNGLTFDEMKNMICPTKTWTNNSRRDFLTSRFNKNMTIQDLIKKQAVNKIIRAYRKYKLFKEKKLKYNNGMNGYEDINDYEDNNGKKLKHKKKKKVSFAQNILIQNDIIENSNEDIQNNEENYHSNESQNSENKETNDNNNNQIKKNKNSKNHEGFSNRMKSSSSSIKTV